MTTEGLLFLEKHPHWQASAKSISGDYVVILRNSRQMTPMYFVVTRLGQIEPEAGDAGHTSEEIQGMFDTLYLRMIRGSVPSAC